MSFVPDFTDFFVFRAYDIAEAIRAAKLVHVAIDTVSNANCKPALMRACVGRVDTDNNFTAHSMC